MADAADLAGEQIDRAMSRFQSARPADAKTGRVGSDCAECGDAIESQRLRIHPFAVRCVECQTAYEEAMTRG